MESKPDALRTAKEAIQATEDTSLIHKKASNGVTIISLLFTALRAPAQRGQTLCLYAILFILICKKSIKKKTSRKGGNIDWIQPELIAVNLLNTWVSGATLCAHLPSRSVFPSKDSQMSFLGFIDFLTVLAHCLPIQCSYLPSHCACSELLCCAWLENFLSGLVNS